jgi:flagellar FliL protein
MTDNLNDANAEEPATRQKPRSSRKKLLVIIGIVAAVVLAGGGVTGYMVLKKPGGVTKNASQSALVALDPFVVNLAEQGRYLKVTMELEVEDAANQTVVKDKLPNLRDAVITLLSSKSSESVSGPEGKFQLKDELILRANQAMGKEVFKNLYFTEFVTRNYFPQVDAF